MVGLVSDSYFVAAEILRKRIFADVALASTLQLQTEVCTGDLQPNHAFQPPGFARDPGHLVKRPCGPAFSRPSGDTPFEDIWAVGDNDNDVDMLSLADRAFAATSCNPAVQALTGTQQIANFDEITQQLGVQASTTA